jgi:hypothetical protein
MRAIQTLAFGALVTAVLGIAGTTTAFAEGKFLLNGERILNPIAAEAEGEFSLTDLTAIGQQVVNCSAFFAGKIVLGGADFELETVLNLMSEATSATPLTGLALACEGSEICKKELAEAWAENLPWLLEVELMTIMAENLFLFKLRENGKGEPAIHYICKTATGNAEDLCIGTLTGFMSNMPTEVLWSLSLTEQEANGEQWLCNGTNAKTGHLEGSLGFKKPSLLSLSE